MKALRNSNWTGLSGLLAVTVILSGTLISHAAMAQEEKAVEGFPTVLQRDITLWSDGTRLSGVLLYPKDRKEGEKLPAIVMCNGWGGTKAFLMRSGIAPRFAAAGYVVINYDYRNWGDSDSRLIDAEKEHYFKIQENSGRVHEILKTNGVPTEYHVLKGSKHYDVYSGDTLDEVMKLEIPWFDKYLKGKR